jgi:glutathione S-transferase
MKFVQITATRDRDGDPVLFALGDDGSVWERSQMRWWLLLNSQGTGYVGEFPDPRQEAQEKEERIAEAWADTGGIA